MAVDVAQGVKTVTVDVAGRTLSLETGLLAEQAHGAVVARYGDTMVLVTVVGEREPNEALDFFPLSVDYEEKMYAAGKIPGGFIKREGRPTEAAVLAARLTDRPLRPLFPKGYRAEVQIISTVMSADQENDPDILSITGASAALMLSPIPWDGPVGAVRVGLVDGKIVVNPTNDDLERSSLDMVVAGTDDAIMMVEGEAGQIPEAILLDAIVAAHDQIKRIVAIQRELAEDAGKDKWQFSPPAKDAQLLDALSAFIGDRLHQAVNNPDKVVRLEGTDELKRDVLEGFAAVEEGAEPRFSPKAVGEAFEALLKAEVRGGILRDGTRPDGRRPEEIRPIWCEVGYLPRTHGSAVFTRGQTQVVTVATLGSTAEEQRIDSISPEDSKRYIHHYNFPPFSVGEVRRLRGPSRRDIGHGALAERALLAVIPNEDTFPYTMRLVSEVVSSNGSTSMASVCGSTLALMDAGVPIMAPVAGVAMGLVTDPDSGRFTVLTDIQGMEDALGDMDFKVAGTEKGITALQMDMKVRGLQWDLLEQALAQARAGRIHILGKMAEGLPQPRTEMSPWAPRIETIMINPDKIRDVIGPGGKMIRKIVEETGAQIDIEDDGRVSIASANAAAREQALAMIRDLTEDIEIGRIYKGRVARLMSFGAFVEIAPKKEGLVRIGHLAEHRVEKVEDVVNIGDEIMVKVIEVDDRGRINLSRKEAIRDLAKQQAEAAGAGSGGPA